MRDLVVGEVYVSSQDGPPNEWQRRCRRVRLRSKGVPWKSASTSGVIKTSLVVEFLLTEEDKPEEWRERYPTGTHPSELAEFFQPEEGGMVLTSVPSWLWPERP